MKKTNNAPKKLTLDKKIVGNLDKIKMSKLVGGTGDQESLESEDALLSIVSCHTYHSGSGCSGCQTCC